MTVHSSLYTSETQIATVVYMQIQVLINAHTVYATQMQGSKGNAHRRIYTDTHPHTHTHTHIYTKGNYDSMHIARKVNSHGTTV